MASSMSTPSPPTTAGLNHTLQVGLITLGLIALLSAASTVLLTGFICYRASRWHAFYSKDIKKNVFVVLLCNLFLADLFQALGFIFSWHWYRLDDIVSFTGTCGAQGFLINFGDVASAFFVLAIAGQTWSHLRFQRRLRFDAFVAIVVCIWIFALVLTVLGPVTSTEYFVDTGAWVSSSSVFVDATPHYAFSPSPRPSPFRLAFSRVASFQGHKTDVHDHRYSAGWMPNTRASDWPTITFGSSSWSSAPLLSMVSSSGSCDDRRADCIFRTRFRLSKQRMRIGAYENRV